MTDAVVREPGDLFAPDSDGAGAGPERLSLHEEAATNDVPPSLISYFESSKSRAAACERLIMGELEGFTTPYDMMNLPAELSMGMVELNEQGISEAEKESSASTDSCIVPDTEALVTDLNVAASHKSEDENETDEHMESEKRRIFKARIPKSPLTQGEIKETSDYEQDQREKRQFVEMKKEEQIRQREDGFQEELKKLMESEKLHQMELELMKKQAQEKLEQELLLQQELISNLQKQVAEERKMMAEELKSIKEEEEKKRKEKEEKRKREEEDRKKMEGEKIKRDMQSMEEEMRRRNEDEENRKIKEIKAEMERRKKEEEQRKKKEEEERRKKEEENNKMEEEKRKTEGERKTDESKKEIRFKTRQETEEKEILINENEGKRKEKRVHNKRQEENAREREEEKTVITVTGKNIEGDIKKKNEEIRRIEEWRKEEGKSKVKDDKAREGDVTEGKKSKQDRSAAELEEMMDEEKIKEHELRKKKEEKGRQEEERNLEEEIRPTEMDKDRTRETKIRKEKEKQEKNTSMNCLTDSENTGSTGPSLTSRLEDSRTSSDLGPLHSEAASSNTAQQHDREEDAGETCKTVDPRAVNLLHTEQKRLSWMNHCISWSKLSLQNKRKQKGSLRSGRVSRRAAEASCLPPLCPDALLQATGCKSLQEVTTVTLEGLPGCSMSTLVQCTQLRSLTLRHCGLRSLGGISQLSHLCYMDVTENEISFVDCENMTSLRVLRLGCNRLTSIHGLSGADNLDVLELSHNNITRIAGLESMTRLQRLSVDHNQLISTKGLRDVYTLLHLNCSHNHLASVEGLENSALLNTLDLRANSLSEPPSLDNHVLLRELRLDDNSISSLQGLAACWLPLMQHLSVAQNRITQLPSMSNFVSLANLDLRFNCMSELQNVCESLEGCHFLQDVHLTGNPLQQECGWRSTLQRALPGLRAIDDQETDSFESPPAAQQTVSSSGSFLTFCQAQLQQIKDLQQQHSSELSKASSSLDAMKSFCRHYTENMKLAEKQRFAHEYGDVTASVGQTEEEKTADMGSTSAKKSIGRSQMESSEKVPAVTPSGSHTGCSHWTFEKSSTDSWPPPEMDLNSLASQGNTFSSHFKVAALSNNEDLDLQNTAAVVIQQQWRRYRPKCRNLSEPPSAEKRGGTGGGGGNQESEPFYINQSVVDRHYAATVIQAFWRGFFVRRRLTSALAAVTYPSTREDDTFEEVDVDEFVFDEAALEKHWTLQLSEDSVSRQDPVSEQPLSPKFPGPFAEPSYYTLSAQPVWRPRQAWVAGEEGDSGGWRASPESSHRKSAASTSVLSGISERSEKILEEWGFTDSHLALMMLKRAQKMKSKQQQKNKRGDPSVRLALFRNCNYQLVPEEAQNRPAPHSRNSMKVCRPETEKKKMERVKQDAAQQRLHGRSDRGSVSEHFLPEMSSDILSGGRVQLVADPAYTERHRASSSSAAQPSRQNSYHASKDAPSPNPVTSVPSKRERISFRDNPVQRSGGWGGGKKRNKVYK